MAFDGIVTRAVVQELGGLAGARISRIHQPHATDIVLTLRVHGETRKLLLSANPTYPRLHLTTEEFVNPQEAPMFCMLLRKHCEGGTITAVTQVDMERIVHIDIKGRDELGDISHKRLVVEIMGKHSNIILLDPESNTIVDSVHHVTPAVSQYRQVLPGRRFIAPPSQGKANPLSVAEADFVMAIDWNGGQLDKQLVGAFTGLSPLVAREILHRAGLPTREGVWQAFARLMAEVKEHRYHPLIVTSPQKSVFSAVELTHAEGETVRYASISECLQAYYQHKAMRDQVKQKVHDLIRIVTNEKQKNEKKLEKLAQTLEEAKDAEWFRLYGELLTAHLHQVRRGDAQLVAVNWYDEAGGTVTIPLDPLKTPSENLQSYYKRYNKLKNSVSAVAEQMARAREEIVYLDGILVQLEHASLIEAEDIREELAEQGYVRARSHRAGRRKKDDRPELESFVSSDGIPILVGKNNRQNDYLTHKLAHGSDTWLHTKDIPGSHVVIRAREVPQRTLEEAAMLAAYYSKARQGSQVPVDYTLVKHVKKPSGAKPGFFIYEHQRTLYVTPDEAAVEKLRSSRKPGNE